MSIPRPFLRVALLLSLPAALACGSEQPPIETGPGSDSQRIGESSSEEAVATALLGLLNQARVAEGLQPVERLASVDAVSLAHSRDMRDNGFFDHVSPTTGDTAARMNAASLRSGLILENVGRGAGANVIHEGLMESPGHRANILNAQVTHVGIGVAQSDEGGRTFRVTQVFIQTTADVDVPAAEAQLLAAINRAREARGVARVEGESNLNEAARAAAERFFADPSASRQDVVDEASRSLRRFGIAYRRIGGLMTVVGAVAEAERLEPTFDEGVGFVGIGVAQGNRPDSPPNSIGVVILMAWPR